MSVMRRPGVAVACVGVLIVAGLCAAMSVSKQRPAGSNTYVKVSGRELFLFPRQQRCTRAPVPRQASSVRLYVRAPRGSGPLEVTISRSGRQIAAGSAEVPVGAGPLDVRLDRTLPADYETSRVCLRNRGERPLALGGNLTSSGRRGQCLRRDLQGRRADRLPAQRTRVGLGHRSGGGPPVRAPEGLRVRLGTALGGRAVRASGVPCGGGDPPPRVAGQALAVRARLGRVPRAGWLCAAVAIANALVWAVITPAFWVPDEVASTGYVQEIGETGRLPAKGQPGLLSREQVVAVSRQPFAIEGKPSWNAPYAADDRAAAGERPLQALRQGPVPVPVQLQPPVLRRRGHPVPDRTQPEHHRSAPAHARCSPPCWPA